MKKQLRCVHCNKLLCKAVFTELEIKCSRCKHMNNLSATEHHKTIERHRAPDKKGAQHEPSKSQYTAG